MRNFILISLISWMGGCCLVLPDWVSGSSELQCMEVETDACPESRRIDGYCCPAECMCGNECVCAETEAKQGSLEHLNDGTCCPEGMHAVWIPDCESPCDHVPKMVQICE